MSDTNHATPDTGMRFVCRGPETFAWVHRLEMRPTDIDCTHMDDAEFDAFIEFERVTEQKRLALEAAIARHHEPRVAYAARMGVEG